MNVSAGLISEVADSIQEEVKGWQDSEVLSLSPIVYLNALMLHVRRNGKGESALCTWLIKAIFPSSRALNNCSRTRERKYVICRTEQ